MSGVFPWDILGVSHRYRLCAMPRRDVSRAVRADILLAVGGVPGGADDKQGGDGHEQCTVCSVHWGLEYGLGKPDELQLVRRREVQGQCERGSYVPDMCVHGVWRRGRGVHGVWSREHQPAVPCVFVHYSGRGILSEGHGAGCREV